jgi:hypothetical protein
LICLETLRFLQLRFPFVEDGAFDGANRKASATVDASRIIYVRIFGAFRVQFSLSPVDTFNGADGNAIGYSFAKIGHDGVGHLANSSSVLSKFLDLDPW